MSVHESIATKRRRLLDPCDIGRSTGGFFDNCRICGVQIIRKGQSRPRICLSCEKKKATPIEDVCKDCQEPIVRSNVRKARICQKCKKTRERTKTETVVGAGGYSFTLTPGFAAVRRVYSAKNRWQFLSQCQHLSDALYQYGYHSHPWFGSDELPGPDATQAAPASGLSKIDVDLFNSPEEIVEYLLLRQQVKKEDGIFPECQKKEPHTPILIPHINPFEIIAYDSPASDSSPNAVMLEVQPAIVQSEDALINSNPYLVAVKSESDEASYSSSITCNATRLSSMPLQQSHKQLMQAISGAVSDPCSNTETLDSSIPYMSRAAGKPTTAADSLLVKNIQLLQHHQHQIHQMDSSEIEAMFAQYPCSYDFYSEPVRPCVPFELKDSNVPRL